jgi:hypothetical protein
MLCKRRGCSKKVPQGANFESALVNGEQSLIMSVDGEPFMTMQIDVGAGQVRRVRIITNPDKLGHLDQPAAIQ